MAPVLVTGGSGFVGDATVRALLAAGRAVRILDLRDHPQRPPEVEFVQGDVRDPAAVARAMRGVRVVHHQVAQVPLQKDRALLESVNVVGTQRVLEAAEAAGVAKVVLVSSSAVYGVPRTVPITAETPANPGEPYGAAKLAAENVAREFGARGLDVAIVRPRTVLGPGRLGIFQMLFEWVRRGRPLYTLGDGHNRYQFVHVDDLARLCLLAAGTVGPGPWLAGTDTFGSVRALLVGLVAHAGSVSPVRALPFAPAQRLMHLTSALGLSPLAPYHALAYGLDVHFDVEPTCRALGWRPQFSNAQMMAASYDWYLAHRAEVLAQVDASPHRMPVAPRLLRLLDFLP